MEKIQVFGIPACTSVKKARAWFLEHGVAHIFHDFKKQGLSEAHLDRWLASVDWQLLLNRKGTTWRGLPKMTQNTVSDQASARAVMLAHPSLVKRPVVVAGSRVMVGVNPEAWSSVVSVNIVERT
ncbi:MAG: Regulatory protein Spx [Pseudomonadota bacterium]